VIALNPAAQLVGNLMGGHWSDRRLAEGIAA